MVQILLELIRSNKSKKLTFASSAKKGRDLFLSFFYLSAPIQVKIMQQSTETNLI